mmetsp:Transcript_16524/g.28074  ORF Transcript_16524/g.28074 Transcript_16524/m.28074 type:complete len:335 (-) Transcript_16524:224-1228(-)
MEAEFQMMKSLKEAQRKEESNGVFQFDQQVKAEVNREAVDEEKAKYGGLTKQEYEEAQKLIDPEGYQAQNISGISKKGFWRDIKRVCLNSDIVIEVLDARDPEGSRCSELEDLVKSEGKKLLLVNNKIDQVPLDLAQKWVDYFKSQGLTCVNFKSNKIIRRKKADEGEEEEKEAGDEIEEAQTQAIEKMMTLLFKYAKKFMEKKGQEEIRVAVIGYSNSGKSSFINQLLRKNLLPTNSMPFLTKVPKEVKLNQHIFLVDTPAIVQSQGALQNGEGTKIVRSALQVDEIEDIEEAAKSVVDKIEKVELLRHYRIGNYENLQGLLEQIAHKKGFIT